jgi:NAD(P)-dependent dehydrogenase (short-subunit alcohol dehydrogenase family)
MKEGELKSIRDAKLRFWQIDVRDKAAQVKAADEAATWAGGIAGLVAGAGIMGHASFLELKEADFDRTMDVNLTGPMLTIQAVLPHLRKTGKGGIVMFASMLARSGGLKAFDYIASKGGVLGLGRSLAMELAETGIRVNTISPSIIDTPMPQAVYSRENLMARAKESPLGRNATVEDMADTALFLLSDDASFVTGQDIRPNGGQRLF